MAASEAAMPSAPSPCGRAAEALPLAAARWPPGCASSICASAGNLEAPRRCLLLGSAWAWPARAWAAARASASSTSLGSISSSSSSASSSKVCALAIGRIGSARPIAAPREPSAPCASNAERHVTVRPLTRSSSRASSIGAPTTSTYSAPASVLGSTGLAHSRKRLSDPSTKQTSRRHARISRSLATRAARRAAISAGLGSGGGSGGALRSLRGRATVFLDGGAGDAAASALSLRNIRSRAATHGGPTSRTSAGNRALSLEAVNSSTCSRCASLVPKKSIGQPAGSASSIEASVANSIVSAHESHVSADGKSTTAGGVRLASANTRAQASAMDECPAEVRAASSSE
eukprot:scaffold315233_cov26-Tisochrysis_lutea.AAC.2